MQTYTTLSSSYLGNKTLGVEAIGTCTDSIKGVIVGNTYNVYELYITEVWWDGFIDISSVGFDTNLYLAKQDGTLLTSNDDGGAGYPGYGSHITYNLTSAHANTYLYLYLTPYGAGHLPTDTYTCTINITNDNKTTGGFAISGSYPLPVAKVDKNVWDVPRVRMITDTAGVGKLHLLGAVPGYNNYDILYQSNAEPTVFYWLFDANGVAWECGVGVVLDDGATLTRMPLFSSNSGYRIDLSAGGVHTVINAPVPGYATGKMNYHGLELKSPMLTAYSEYQTVAYVQSNGFLYLDLSWSNVFTSTQAYNLTNLILTNVPGSCASFTLHLTQDSTGGRTITFPSSTFKWGVEPMPTFSLVAGKRNKFVFDTINSGATWDVGYCGAF